MTTKLIPNSQNVWFCKLDSEGSKRQRVLQTSEKFSFSLTFTIVNVKRAVLTIFMLD